MDGGEGKVRGGGEVEGLMRVVVVVVVLMRGMKEEESRLVL